MPDQDEEKMTSLDRMIAEDQLQMLKAAIPYLNPKIQPTLSVMAKAMELNRTIRLFQQPSELTAMSSPVQPKADPLELLSELSQYATGERKETLDNMISTLSAFMMIQTYQEEET